MFRKFNSITLWLNVGILSWLKIATKTLLSLLFVSESSNKDATKCCAYYSGASWIHRWFIVCSNSNQMDHHVLIASLGLVWIDPVCFDYKNPCNYKIENVNMFHYLCWTHSVHVGQCYRRMIVVKGEHTSRAWTFLFTKLSLRIVSYAKVWTGFFFAILYVGYQYQEMCLLFHLPCFLSFTSYLNWGAFCLFAMLSKKKTMEKYWLYAIISAKNVTENWSIWCVSERAR